MFKARGDYIAARFPVIPTQRNFAIDGKEFWGQTLGFTIHTEFWGQTLGILGTDPLIYHTHR